MSYVRALRIGTVIWAVSPWLFLAVYSFHPPDHADPFWMFAMPAVFVSLAPMMLFSSKYTIVWLIVCSLFNLGVGLSATYLMLWFSKRKDGVERA